MFADEVYLRGGGRFSGEIVEQTEDSVTVDIGGGYLTAPMSTVVRIEEGVSPLAEYRERAAGIPPGDAEAWRELARWATSKTLSSQSWEAYSQVVAILPDDDEANRALGRVLLNGKWVTEDESYRARGYIEFENQWMTPAERKAILAERQAQEQADRQANEAEIRAIQADIDAEQAARGRGVRASDIAVRPLARTMAIRSIGVGAAVRRTGRRRSSTRSR